MKWTACFPLAMRRHATKTGTWGMRTGREDFRRFFHSGPVPQPSLGSSWMEKAPAVVATICTFRNLANFSGLSHVADALVIECSTITDMLSESL